MVARQEKESGNSTVRVPVHGNNHFERTITPQGRVLVSITQNDTAAFIMFAMPMDTYRKFIVAEAEALSRIPEGA